MAITVTSLGSVADTNARSNYTCTIARAPGDNKLILVGVILTDAAGDAGTPTAVVGAGLTFTLVSEISFHPFATPASATRNLSVWRGMGSSLVSSVITVTPVTAATGCAILTAEISGVTTSGVNGANAVGQSVTAGSDADSANTISAPAAAGWSGNAWISHHGVDAGGLSEAPSGNYQAIDACNYATPNVAFESAWTTLSTGNMVVWSQPATSQSRGGTLVELVAEDVPGTAAAQWAQGQWARGVRGFPPRITNAWVESGHAENTDPYTDTSEG